ncbi:hypothetical protein GTO10_05395 [Candidatus Saccharibacteria bacterium]|nr:hypothetical protein [Candidatus Saccharibacteria bacterium]
MRLKVVFVFFALVLVFISLRLFKIQVIDHEQYLILAEGQRVRSYEIPAERGRIFSSGGILATNEEAYRLFADLNAVEDPESLAQELVPILLEDHRFFTYNPMPSELVSKVGDSSDPRETLTARLVELLTKEDRQWVSLARKVSLSVAEKVREKEFAGLTFEPDPRRFYPEGTLGAGVLGFVASDEEGSDRGYNGLEGYYDGDLRGKAGWSASEYSPTRQSILIGTSSAVEAQNGADLYLTVNRGVQTILEEKIKEGVERYGAKSGSFVAIEPKTGKILAMGNYPSFDPGNFSPLEEGGDSDYGREFRNLSIATTYEPGSIMKPVTLSSALDSGKIGTDWTFVDSGPLKIGESTINTWDGKHWGKQTLSELLQKSNNVGAAQVALEVGAETLRSYFLNFGFGSSLGVDLEGEEAGLVKDLKNWRRVDLATAGFGQGVAVTPLQMTAAYAAIANGGVLMKPYVVEKIIDRAGREIDFSPTPIRRVISPQTADVVTELLRSATSGGESVALRNARYVIAGKTGTAQIPVGGRYDPNKSNTTFVGFPFKDKEFVMLIRLEEPTTSTFSATTVVPLWLEAFEKVAPLFGILPDR